MRTHRIAFKLALGLAACGGDDGTPPAPAAVEDAAPGPGPDTGSLPGPDAAVDPGVGDAGAQDAGTTPAPDAAPVPEDAALPPAPEQAFTEPTPFVVTDWLVAQPVNGDPIFDRLATDDFAPPDGPGRDARGLSWRAAVSDENGALPDPGGGLLYAVARVNVEAETRLVAQADRVLAVFANGHLQPGDVYGSGAMRVPVLLHAGENVIVVRAFGGRGAPVLRLWQTPDALAPNLADTTFPDLPVGETRTQYAGIALLNGLETAVTHLRAEVVESDLWAPTTWTLPALAPMAATHVAFELRPKRAPTEGEMEWPVTVRVSGDGLPATYTQALTLRVVPAASTHRESFLSGVDGSAQYFGVVPPADFEPGRAYGMVLTLHGAGVQGIGQAAAYSAKDWTWIVAPTNRRPFGFDWEEWGRLDALETLEHAMTTFGADPTRVYLTGHSMGGHGTWNVGVHNPGRFAVLGPSAGWSSFYTYGGESPPTGPFGRARASSDTPNFLSNLAQRGVYVIHGDADDNVPVSEGRTLVGQVREYTDDVQFHEQPGAGHWWDGDLGGGADCVDWPPLFDFMQARTLDPFELDFAFRTPSPWTTPRHSFVTLRSAVSADEDCTVSSTRAGDTVTLDTTNVRGLELDGAALRARGVTRAVVDGRGFDVPEGPLAVGPQTGKRPGQHGPFNDVLQRPFCYVYATDDTVWQRYASFQVSTWAHIGNGTACALPIDAVTPMLRATYNLVYVGAQPNQLPTMPEGLMWDDLNVTLGDTDFFRASVAYVYPDGDRMTGVLSTAYGEGASLWLLQPFSSRGGMPDWLVYDAQGGLAAGFFDPEWAFR